MTMIKDSTGRASLDALPVGAPSSPSPAPAPPADPVTLTPTHSSAPWIAGRMFSVVPSAALSAVEEDTDETWYAITRGRFVGVTNIPALDGAATLRVSGASHKGFSTQAAALRAFNAALENHAVEVVL
ncbi:hypothetical protein C8F04DRAFT_1255675 [Mycena alexandri]|uniref:Uncharacterized protein n=1 Tax=Mycena alexandri TaxID=1745969 RepID=A0AAD6X4J8_9AGAR|nr:hypothetical protein C8F04DRAFT_1255675 [Mycena alexandri]